MLICSLVLVHSKTIRDLAAVNTYQIKGTMIGPDNAHIQVEIYIEVIHCPLIVRNKVGKDGHDMWTALRPGSQYLQMGKLGNRDFHNVAAVVYYIFDPPPPTPHSSFCRATGVLL